MVTLFPEQSFVFPTANNELEFVCLISLYTCCNSTPNTSSFFKSHPKIFRYVRNSIILLSWRSLSKSLWVSSPQGLGCLLWTATILASPLSTILGNFFISLFPCLSWFLYLAYFLPDFLYGFCEVHSQVVFRVTLHGNKSTDTLCALKCFLFCPNVSLIIWLNISFLVENHVPLDFYLVSIAF